MVVNIVKNVRNKETNLGSKIYYKIRKQDLLNKMVKNLTFSRQLPKGFENQQTFWESIKKSF